MESKKIAGNALVKGFEGNQMCTGPMQRKNIIDKSDKITVNGPCTFYRLSELMHIHAVHVFVKTSQVPLLIRSCWAKMRWPTPPGSGPSSQ